MVKRLAQDHVVGNCQVGLQFFSSGPHAQPSSPFNLEPLNPKGCLTAGPLSHLVSWSGEEEAPAFPQTHLATHPPEVPLKLIVFTASLI